jgi:hypothetical protein
LKVPIPLKDLLRSSPEYNQVVKEHLQLRKAIDDDSDSSDNETELDSLVSDENEQSHRVPQREQSLSPSPVHNRSNLPIFTRKNPDKPGRGRNPHRSAHNMDTIGNNW